MTTETNLGTEPIETEQTTTTTPPVEKTKEEHEAEALKWKKAFDKTSSELANVKKLYKDKLTEEERKASEQQELQEAMRNELETLRKEKKVAQITAKVADIGIEVSVASKMAESYVEDDADVFFGLLKGYVNGLKDELRKEGMKGQPSPQGGGLPKAEEPDFSKMTLSEMTEYFKAQGVNE